MNIQKRKKRIAPLVCCDWLTHWLMSCSEYLFFFFLIQKFVGSTSIFVETEGKKNCFKKKLRKKNAPFHKYKIFFEFVFFFSCSCSHKEYIFQILPPTRQQRRPRRRRRWAHVFLFSAAAAAAAAQVAPTLKKTLKAPLCVCVFFFSSLGLRVPWTPIFFFPTFMEQQQAKKKRRRAPPFFFSP